MCVEWHMICIQHETDQIQYKWWKVNSCWQFGSVLLFFFLVARKICTYKKIGNYLKLIRKKPIWNCPISPENSTSILWAAHERMDISLLLTTMRIVYVIYTIFIIYVITMQWEIWPRIEYARTYFFVSSLGPICDNDAKKAYIWYSFIAWHVFEYNETHKAYESHGNSLSRSNSLVQHKIHQNGHSIL